MGPVFDMKRSPDPHFSPEETQQRITAAVRGARIVGHKPMKGEAPKPAKRKRAGRKAKR
jgi:hypothetical protein